MALPTLHHIDAAGGSDVTGDGSAGNPYQTLQHAVNNAGSPGGGNAFMLGNNAPHLLTADFDWLSHSMAQSFDEWVQILTWDNGGGAGVNAVWDANGFKLTNSSGTLARYITPRGIDIVLGSAVQDNFREWQFYRCHLRDSTVAANTAFFIPTNGTRVIECTFTNFDGYLSMGGRALLGSRIILKAGYTMTNTNFGVVLNSSMSWCLIDARLAGSVINLFDQGNGNSVINNTFLGNANVTRAIYATGNTPRAGQFLNNYVEGLTAGTAISLTGDAVLLCGGNKCFNCATPISIGQEIIHDDGNGGMEVLPSSGLVDLVDFVPNSQLIGTGFGRGLVDAPGGSVVGCVHPPLPDLPAEADVRNGTTYDNGLLTGNMVMPPEANVITGTGYGTLGVEFGGTLVIDYPAVGDVEAGVSFNSGASIGTFVAPGAGSVLNGTGYGEDGTEFTGTYNPPAGGGGSSKFGVSVNLVGKLEQAL